MRNKTTALETEEECYTESRTWINTISSSRVPKDQSRDLSRTFFQTPRRHLKTLEGHTAAISCVKFSNDGNLLASASVDKTMILWSATNYTLIHRNEGHSNRISDLAWSSDSHYTCSASDDSTLWIWDARSPYECLKVLRGLSNFFSVLISIFLRI